MTLSELLLGLGEEKKTTVLNPLEQLQAHYAGKWKFIVKEPNPDYVNAPYEESGIGDLDFLNQLIREFGRSFRAKGMTLRIEKEGELFKFHVKED